MKTSTHRRLTAALLGAAAACALLSTPAMAADTQVQHFDIPAQDAALALNEYARQAGVQIVFPYDAVRGRQAPSVQGDLTREAALALLTDGMGLKVAADRPGMVTLRSPTDPQSGSAAGGGAEVEALIVTAQKREEDIQDVPIAISAFTQETLTERQIAGGPDLITQIPNFTFTKTNFASYSIQIRGIGTQAISVGTDPAVAVAFNGTPFIRNHFFEQEFYDVASVEILRGPQGTLFGRNATAGVVNVRSAPPVYRYEAKVSGDLGNYDNRRLEGMINIPVAEAKLALRFAGEWTKRDGYSYNETTNRPTDGRDLWSTRVSLRFEPHERVRANLIWEHFSEDDDRIRSAKQLCKKDPGPDEVDGLALADVPDAPWEGPGFSAAANRAWLTQGCLPVSLYSDEAFQTPNGQAIPFVAAGQYLFQGTADGTAGGHMLNQVDPYASQSQSRDLRVFQSALDPTYRARNNTYELNVDVDLSTSLTLTSQTGYSDDEIRSTQDFNRFNTAPGLFSQGLGELGGGSGGYSEGSPLEPGGVYCDPQLGCSTAMVGADLSQAWGKQFSQELRLASDFDGPLNFSIGANFMRYKTLEDYYVFFNLITAIEQVMNGSASGHYDYCHPGDTITPEPFYVTLDGVTYYSVPSNGACTQGFGVGTYIDPNPINQLDGLGHNYFRSKNPYRLRSYAAFGEAYYQVTPRLKLTAGLRWTYDKKLSTVVPSQVFLVGGGYPESGVIDQEWKETTGRFVADWSPDLSFTDETLIYASYARGYKAGGANPPGPAFSFLSGQSTVVHPPTFEPEFVDAYELGSKNVLLNGALTVNADIFYYDYKAYQISQIVDRTSVNLNFDAKVKGFEIEGHWQASEAFRLNFSGGLQESSVGKGQSAIDLIDRTAGQPGWMVVKPFLTDTSNCILPDYVVRAILEEVPYDPFAAGTNGMTVACSSAYNRDSLVVS
jgi:iron complex outermembrane receptor protein